MTVAVCFIKENVGLLPCQFQENICLDMKLISEPILSLQDSVGNVMAEVVQTN